MKNVFAEVLAKNVKDWPDDATHAVVGDGGSLSANAKIGIGFTREGAPVWEGNRFSIMGAGRSVYWIPSAFIENSFGLSQHQDNIVTRTQWEAERARIAAMEGISAVSQEQANAEAERDQQAQYEQELWDKVAERVFSKAFVDGLSGWGDTGFELEARRAMSAADAFMAERAKRLKGAK